MTNVQLVQVENIHQVEQKNVFHVQQAVQILVMHQQVNARNVSLDMDIQVEHVRNVQQEHMQRQVEQ